MARRARADRKLAHGSGPVRCERGRAHASVVVVADADQGNADVADGEGREHDGATAGWQQGHGVAESGGADGRLADADSAGRASSGSANAQRVAGTRARR